MMMGTELPGTEIPFSSRPRPIQPTPHPSLPHTRASSCRPYWAPQHVSLELLLYHYQTPHTGDSIRIVVLDPADNHEAPLTCTIFIRGRPAFLQSTDSHINKYEAISYAWGTPTFTKSIICDKTSFLKITHNVDSLLRSVRKPCQCRNLWIDAISLNQADLDEKSQQVPLMGNIYHQASKVIVWHGPEEKRLKEVFAFIRVLGTLQPLDICRIDNVAAAIWGPELGTDSLKRFLNRTWFERRWFLPEASEARSTIARCGDEKIAWK